MSRNDITGDKIATKPASDAYRDNWGPIFGKAVPVKEVPAPVVEDKENRDEHIS